MSVERQKVLEMLAQGKISVEDADRLLDKLNAAGSQPGGADGNAEPASGKKSKFMRIIVERPGRENVNVRVPLTYARTWKRLVAFLPPKVSEKLAEMDIDLAQLGGSDEEWARAMEELNVDIDKGSGNRVRVYCE